MSERFLLPSASCQDSPKSNYSHRKNASKYKLTKSGQLLSKNMCASQKNLGIPSEYGLSWNFNYQASKVKNQLNPSKSLTKRLFQRAKLIKDPKKQTFLPASRKCIQKKTPTISTQQSQQHIQELEPIKNLCYSAKKSYSSQKVSFGKKLKQITVSSPLLGQGSKDYDSPKKRENNKKQLRLQAGESKLVRESSLFSSQSGQSVLFSLKRNLNNISSIEKRIINKSKNSLNKQWKHHQSQKISEFHIGKFDNNEGDESQKVSKFANNIEPKLNKQQSQNKIKPKSQFSQLIMEDDYGMYNSTSMKKQEFSRQSYP